MKIAIDPEFSALLPERDIKDLEEQIVGYGAIRDPIVVWECNGSKVLLDGHRRQRIKDRHPELPMPRPVVLEFETRDEAHDWVIHNQLARRNTTPEERRYLLGKLYLKNKPKPGNTAPKRSAKVADPSSRTAQEVADSEGVSVRTVHGATKFAKAVDAAPEIRDEVISGKSRSTATDLQQFAKLPPKAKEKATAAIKDGVPVKRAVAAAKPKQGQPTKDARKFSELESQIGKCVRANTAVKDQFGGAKFHEQIRQHLNECLKVLATWRKEAKPA